jgi:hypothetical protein
MGEQTQVNFKKAAIWSTENTNFCVAGVFAFGKPKQSQYEFPLDISIGTQVTIFSH